MNENMPAFVQSPAEEVVDVEIATPKSRIIAYLLNTLFTVLVFVPPFFVLILPLLAAGGEDAVDSAALSAVSMIGLGLSGLLILAYTVVQCWLMSKHGQSIGKRIMKIRLLKTDGSNPGFWYAVMVREVGFNIVLGLATLLPAYLLVFLVGKDSVTAEQIGNALSLIVWLVCLSMLFEPKKNRHTLHDYFADTVVVKLPDQHGR